MANETRNMKGFELYSWLKDGHIVYTLLFGTNRNKDMAEVLRPNPEDRFDDLPALKIRLRSLEKGQHIFWLNSQMPTEKIPSLAFPPEETIQDLLKTVHQLGLELIIPDPMK